MAQVKPLKLLADGNLSQIDTNTDDLTSNTVTSKQLNITADVAGEKIIVQAHPDDLATKIINVKDSDGATVAYFDEQGNAVMQDLEVQNLTVNGVETVVGEIQAQSNLLLSGDITVEGNGEIKGNIVLGTDGSETIEFKVTSTTDLDMGSNRLINLANPIDPQDAVTKQYLDDVSGSGTAWSYEGNVVTAGDFLGSTNDADVVIKRNNTEIIKLSPTLNSGVGKIDIFEKGTLAYVEFNGELALGLASNDAELNSPLDTDKIIVTTGNTFEGRSGGIEISTGGSNLGDTGDIQISTGLPDVGERGSVTIVAEELVLSTNTVPSNDLSFSMGASGLQFLETHSQKVVTENVGTINDVDVSFKRNNLEFFKLAPYDNQGNTGLSMALYDIGFLAYAEWFGKDTLILGTNDVPEGSTDESIDMAIFTGNTQSVGMSGNIEMMTGSALVSGNTGNIDISTGVSVSGAAGHIDIFTGNEGNFDDPILDCDTGSIRIITGPTTGLRGIVSLEAPEVSLLYGNLRAAGTTNLTLQQDANDALIIESEVATLNRHLLIKANVADTEDNLFEIRNSAGTPVAFIDEDGDITVNNMNITGSLTVTDVTETETSLAVNGDLTVEGFANIKGDVTLGSDSGDDITFNGLAATALSMNSHKITSLSNGTDPTDAVNLSQLNTAIGSLGTLGLPSDGSYGGPNGNISGVEQNDTYENAFDKLETILGKLAPAKPANLSTKTLAITGTYSAYESGTGSPTLRSTVIDDTTPLAQTLTGAANGFWDAEDGTLTAEIDAVSAGSKLLSPASDVGTFTSLRVISDYDFYAGQAGKEFFWSALIAGVESSSPLSLGGHTYRLLHSKTGNTPALSFWVDDPGAVTVTSQSIVGSGTGRYISGVPSLNTSDTITATFTVNNAIRQHYNPTRIAAASSTLTNSVNQTLPVSPPPSGATYSGNIALTVQAAKYGETTTVACTGYNSKGTTGSANAVANIRVDTVSSEIRVKSGQGQYPSFGVSAAQYGDTFDSTVSLVNSGNEELQLLNGLYQFPTGNYTTNLPVAGPNYSSAAGGGFSNYRWVTLNLGTKTAVSSITITINGGVNLGASTLISGLALYAKVDGAIPTNGWIDGNAAYPGVGNPTNNGDASLVIGSSTTTTKVITFGATVRTGTVYVRVGIPLASTKRFTTITIL